MNRSKTTTDHDEIRRWAEERGGKPAAVTRTRKKDDVGMIRIDFPGYSGGGSLESISWDEWFEKFDDSNLAMILQEETADGDQSNFNRLIARESVETGKGGAKKATKTKRRATTRAGTGSRSTSRAKSTGTKARGKGTAASKTRSSRSRASSRTRARKRAR